MIESLYGKTFVILGSQLAVTWLTTLLLIGLFRWLHRAKVSWVTGQTNKDGQTNLDFDRETVKPYFLLILVGNFASFIALYLFGIDDLAIGIPLFTVWSVLTGLMVGFSLLAVDENLGGKVLGLTALIIFAAALIGTQTGIDFTFLDHGLSIALYLLIAAGLLRLFLSINGWVQRMMALSGIVVFTGYLLLDFYRLSQMSGDLKANNWQSAMVLAINLYLDIINLFLDLLDWMSG